MIMSYILVNQHNNVINWSLNQLNMLIFLKIKSWNNGIAREARRKFLARGGQKFSWGGTQIFLDGGGQALMGGDFPFMGGDPPPSPPCLAALAPKKWWF